ncbi:MAG: phosphodiester glycosidase family protein, partial [Armatimonadetes bacterium]|nr:phosphodiester glycosidase family protein [Armatimonadota bacterium]
KYGRAATDTPRPLRLHALRIDLRAPGLSFLATPPNLGGEKHTIGATTGTFLTERRLQAAINAAPFGPIHREEGKPVGISGLTVSRGRTVSPPTDLPALVISRRNEARIAEPPFDLRDIHTAVAGFSVVLRNGEITGKADALHPRTAAGVSQDGRTLFLMVIDGRQPGYSEGITSAEVGAWLRALGAWDGINLDGGGTSTMVIEDRARTARIMNLPIHDGMPGRQRVAGSHLGLKARRLSGGPQLPLP